MFDFFWVPVIVALFTAVAVRMLRPLAFRGELLDRPGGRKRHSGAVPLVGGIAITFAVWAGSFAFVRVADYHVALLAGVTMLAVVGMVDDMRGMSPLAKLCAQLFAAILMTSWGGVFLTSLGDVLGKREIELTNWGIPLTLFAVVTVVNATNMMDGLDGLAGGLALTVFGWLTYLSGDVGNTTAQRYCVIFVGALVGFLVFNLPNPLRGRNRVFLGDAGSLMLGFAIVWFTVELSQPAYNYGRHIPPVVMLWLLGVLLIDLLAVTVRRAMAGRNPLSADRTHLHHILVRLDLPPAVVVWCILLINAGFGAIGVIAWKSGVPEYLMFLTFLMVAAAHLAIMQSAPRFVRRARRMLSRRQ